MSYLRDSFCSNCTTRLDKVNKENIRRINVDNYADYIRAFPNRIILLNDGVCGKCYKIFRDTKKSWLNSNQTTAQNHVSNNNQNLINETVTQRSNIIPNTTKSNSSKENKTNTNQTAAVTFNTYLNNTNHSSRLNQTDENSNNISTMFECDNHYNYISDNNQHSPITLNSKKRENKRGKTFLQRKGDKAGSGKYF